jgi:hypothetical protein
MGTVEPAFVQPEPDPAYVEPEPEPEPVFMSPEPAYVEPEPEPVAAEPEPAFAEPEPEPAFLSPEPEPYAPEPYAPSEPEPYVAPEPYVEQAPVAAVAPKPDLRAAAAAAMVVGAPDVRLFDAAEQGVLEPDPVGGFAGDGAGMGAGHRGAVPPGVAPGPVVSGRFCGRQHFNDPRDAHCRICGLPLNPESTPEVQAERPPLGVLVWDSGDSDPVTGDLIVGRDPSGDAEVASGQVGGLTPSGHSEGMSRVHAELRIVGWDVTLADRGSTNGTFIWEEDRQSWHRLEVGERAMVKVGAIIAFGERTATFELPNG